MSMAGSVCTDIFHRWLVWIILAVDGISRRHDLQTDDRSRSADEGVPPIIPISGVPRIEH